jgi:hypothetical protein
MEENATCVKTWLTMSQLFVEIVQDFSTKKVRVKLSCGGRWTTFAIPKWEKQAQIINFLCQLRTECQLASEYRHLPTWRTACYHSKSRFRPLYTCTKVGVPLSSLRNSGAQVKVGLFRPFEPHSADEKST